MYAESTQFQRWHFTTEEIDARRSKAYQNCLDAMERLSRDVSDPEDRAMLDLSQSLSREDSQKLQNLVERKTFRIAKEFQFPVSVPVNIPTIAHIDVLRIFTVVVP